MKHQHEIHVLANYVCVSAAITACFEKMRACFRGIASYLPETLCLSFLPAHNGSKPWLYCTLHSHLRQVGIKCYWIRLMFCTHLAQA